MTPIEVISLFFCEDVAFAQNLVSTHPPTPIGVLVVLATPVKNYLK